LQAIILFLNSVYLLSLKYVIHINVIHNNVIMFFLGKFYFRTLFRYFRTLPVGGEVAAAWERLLGVRENDEKVRGNKIFLFLLCCVLQTND